MANDINNFTFTGRLGADPEVRDMPSGEPVCDIRVAVGESWKDKASGERKERVEWVSVTAFGKLAEICGEYLRKGSQIAGVGKLRTRKWQDKQGNDRYTTEVVMDQMSMMGKAPEGGGRSGERAQAPQGAQRTTAAAPPREDFDDDIPF